METKVLRSCTAKFSIYAFQYDKKYLQSLVVMRTQLKLLWVAYQPREICSVTKQPALPWHSVPQDPQIRKIYKINNIPQRRLTIHLL